MPLIVPQVATMRQLLRLARNAGGDQLTVKLYKNNYTPIATTTLANLTEADFNGYAPQIAANWSAPAISGFGRAFSEADPQSYVKGAAAPTNQIYGYFVIDAGGFLYWAQRFDFAPYNMVNPGDQIVMTPIYTLVSEF